MIRLLAILMTSLVVGCSSGPEQSVTAPAPQASPAAEASPASVDSAPKAAPWVQFGLVAQSIPVTVVNADGQREPGMGLSILLDSGETVVVEQALSQAGKLEIGDRVRVLRIGKFTRVTFWPYGNLSISPAR